MAQARKKTTDRGQSKDNPTQARESGEPRVTGKRSVAGKGNRASGSAARTQAKTGKDSPEQAWESGRPEAMP